MFGTALAGVDNSKVGTSAFDFLKIQIGARPVAMGGAFTGLANDETSLYYNPAGIVSLDGIRFMADYNNNIFDIQSGFLGGIYSINDKNKVAIQIDYLGYGEFDRTDEFGQPDDLDPTFGGSDFLLAATYARKITPVLHLGATAKLIYEKIDKYSASGFAFDLGAKYLIKTDRYDNSQRIAIGLMLQNLGSQTKTFIDGGSKDPLPFTVRLGGSAILEGLPVLMATDLVFPRDNDIYFALGFETTTLRPLFLRLGWNSFGSNYKTGSSSDNLAGFSTGFGVEYKKMQISYTYTPQAELGGSHRITFTGGIL
jgi:hypothetical protein